MCTARGQSYNHNVVDISRWLLIWQTIDYFPKKQHFCFCFPKRNITEALNWQYLFRLTLKETQVRLRSCHCETPIGADVRLCHTYVHMYIHWCYLKTRLLAVKWICPTQSYVHL
jgi:hypothetical protein